MGVPTVEVCRTATDKTQVNTVCLCWCAGPLLEQAKTGKFKTGVSGEDVKHLHEHLVKFNFDLELKNSKSSTPVDSDDFKNDKWGKFTTRAVRMFALHPQVDTEPESIVAVDGSAMTEAIAEKICQWCSHGTASPKDYWDFKQLSVSDGKTQVIDAHGDDLGHGKQNAWHHHIRQIQEDLSKTGFEVHKDALCQIDKDYHADGQWWESVPKPRTVHFHNEVTPAAIDKSLRDLKYLTRKFQRQAGWLWRMDNTGKQLPDISAGDPTHYAGAVTGVMDHDTAKVLHAWVTGKLHMVIKKFTLKDLHWPPESGTDLMQDSNKAAQLRSDAYDAWLAAAKEIYKNNATIEGTYSSSPRGWSSGKNTPPAGTKNANSPFSWHYSALGVDISQSFQSSDGSINDGRFRYVLEEDVDRFRIWCWVVPQPAIPKDPADDLKDSLLQFRNRNIRLKHDISAPNAAINSKEPSDPSPLACIHSDGNTKTTVKTGWYFNVTSVLENNGLKRIPRRHDWQTNAKGWEWWHYQFEPPKPSWLTSDFNFGDYLQMIGVHEYRLRNVGDGWVAHEDIEHAPG